MALTLCVLWTALRLMKRPGVLRGLLFALAGAFCANMKVIGFALWGLCALFVLLRQLLRRQGGGRVWAAGLAAFFGFIGFYTLLTPALWREPLAFFRYLVENALDFSRWKNYVRFRGTTFLLGKERLPWYYLPYMIAATTPLWTLFLCAVGQLGALKSWKKGFHGSDRALGLLLCSLLWLLPLGAAVLAHATVYNGWRHFYFLYGPMLVLAAYGLHGLYRLMEGKRLASRLLTVLLSLCMALTGVGIATQHPYQYAYEQPVVRLLTGQDDRAGGRRDRHSARRPVGPGRAGERPLCDGAPAAAALYPDGGRGGICAVQSHLCPVQRLGAVGGAGGSRDDPRLWTHTDAH